MTGLIPPSHREVSNKTQYLGKDYNEIVTSIFFINVEKTSKETNNDQLSQLKKIYTFKNLIELQFLKVHKEILKPPHKDTVLYSL